MDPEMPVLERMTGLSQEIGVSLPDKIPPDISNDLARVIPEFVNTRPKRGRPFGTTDKAKANGVKKKGRENRTKTVELLPFEKEGPLSREDVKCTICMSIFIEPVILPCKHCLCLECYRSSMEKATLCCPICRFRLSSWGRKNTSQLVNKEFWERIKTQFPDEVEARLQGQDSQDFTSSESPAKPAMRDGFVAQEGEIRLELEKIQKQHDQDLENEKRKEAEASSELIRQLQEEEGPLPPVQSPTQVMRDFELARKLQEEEERERQATRFALASSRQNQGLPISHSSTLRKPGSSNSKKRGNAAVALTTPAPMAFKRICTTDPHHKQNKITTFFEPPVQPRSRSGTPDSINLEFSQHFTPISPAPKTPPKKNKDGTVDAMVFVKSRPVRRDLSIEFGMLGPNTNTTPEVGREARVDFELIRTDEFEEPLEHGSAVGSEYEPINGTEQELLVPNITGSDMDLEIEKINENEAQLPGPIEPDLNSSNEYEYDARAAKERKLELQNPQENKDKPLRSVEYYLENLGSSDSVVMGSEESDSEQPQYPGLVIKEDENPRPVISPVPLEDPNDSENSSEYEFNLTSAERAENARALEKWKQEEEDRKFALKLQRELNRPVVNRDKYLLRAPEERRKVKQAPDTSSSVGNLGSAAAGRPAVQVSKPSTSTNGNKASTSANSSKPSITPSAKPSTSAVMKTSTPPVVTRNGGRSNLQTTTPKRPTRTRSSSRQRSTKSINKIDNYLVRSSERVRKKVQYAQDSSSCETSSVESNQSSWSPSMEYSGRKGFQAKPTSSSTGQSQSQLVNVNNSAPNNQVQLLKVVDTKPSPNNVQPATNNSAKGSMNDFETPTFKNGGNLSISANGTPLRERSSRQRRRPRRFSSSSSSGSSTGVAVGTPSR